MGRWRVAASILLTHISRKTSLIPTPSCCLLPKPNHASNIFNLRRFSAIPSRVSPYSNDFDSGSDDSYPSYPPGTPREDEETGKIPVKAYFLCTSIDLKSMQAENFINVVPPTSRSTNYIALKFCTSPTEITALGVKDYVICRYMIVFQYGSAVLFNIEDHEVETFLELVRRHASGLLPEMRRDGTFLGVKETCVYVSMRRLCHQRETTSGKGHAGRPLLHCAQTLDTDSICIIGSVLGQSIALDYFVSQVDGMVEEFAGINRLLEKNGTFTMDRTKLLQLVGKANSNLADVILKVGLFERSEIAWRDAKYSQIYDYLREEYEITQRFGSLDYKLKFVEHNIHFLQEVIQNRRSDLLEWCIIFLLSVENIISIYEIVQG